METKRAALYIRVSTQEQAQEGYSIGAQTERLEAYCKSRDWTVANIYTDPGFSGAKTERPALQRMIRDIESGAIDIVVVYKLDRLSRSQKDTLYLIEDVFLKNNTSFVSINENFDTSTAFGRAMIGILSVFAQLEREQIKERTLMGRIERAKDGYFHGGGFDPIGYDYVDGHLVINEYEAMQVRKVFEMFVAGQSINYIHNYMKKRYTTKYSNWGAHSAVRSVLSTPLYIGKISYHDTLYEGRHESIIDEDTYNQAQEILEKRAAVACYNKNPFQSSNLLTGLLKCECCGARLFAKGNYSGRGIKTYRPYYTCYSRSKSVKTLVRDPNCKCLSLAVCHFDYIVVSEIRKLQLDPDYIYKICHSSDDSPNESILNTLQAKLKDINNQEKRLIDLYQLGTVSMTSITERINALAQEKITIQNEIDALKPKKKMPISKALNILNSEDDIFNSGSLEQQKAFLQSLIDYISVDESQIYIHWKFA